MLLSSGLRDVGYEYVVLDDCWSDGRGKDGKIIADKEKFPHGMKWVAKQLHDQRLLYGMYSSAGELTCARYEGSLDHEEADAQSWASWDVDYLKYDNCYHRGRLGYPEISFNRYNKMWEALNATGRPILYSLCNWGEDMVHSWAWSIANSWRVSGDIYDHFNRPDALCSCTTAYDPHCVAPGSHCSTMNIINKVAPYVDRGQYGGWNDLDMLEVGLGGQTDEEYKSHFTMWAALKSPLLIGADLRELSAKTLTILNNPAVIALNQDPLGRSVTQIFRDRNVKKDRYGEGEVQIWAGPLYPADQLVIFLNAADEDLNLSVTLNDIFVHEGPEGSAPHTKEDWDVYDLWADRMDDFTAEQILGGEEQYAAKWYNSTQVPYKIGLDNGDSRLLGKPVGCIGPQHHELKAEVPRHGVRAFRLRGRSGGSSRYSLHRSEL